MTRTSLGLLAGAAGLLVGFWGGWQAYDAWYELSPRNRADTASTPPAPGEAARSAPSGPVMTAAPSPDRGVDRAPPATAEGPVVSADEAIRELRTRDLLMPVYGVAAKELVASFDQARSGARQHEAIDIMAPRGTAVVAVDDGTIARLFTSELGGLTIYQFDPKARYAYYYAHLDRYAPGLAEGQAVRRGQLVGFVGSTGNASPSAPHLHFGIFVLTPERRWWQGTPLDPHPLLAQ